MTENQFTSKRGINHDTNYYYEHINYEDVLKNAPYIIRNYFNKEDEFVGKYIKKGESVLDIGCGYGREFPLLAGTASKVIGVDYSKSQLKQAKKTASQCLNVSIKYMDATSLFFENNSFDKVVCLGQTFGNFENSEEIVLKEMYRVLNKSGEIYISVFNEFAREAHVRAYKNAKLNILENNKKYVRLKEGLYSRRFSKQDIFKLVKRCNISYFNIVEFTSIAYQLFCRK